jgi:hypothetical protein
VVHKATSAFFSAMKLEELWRTFVGTDETALIIERYIGQVSSTV